MIKHFLSETILCSWLLCQFMWIWNAARNLRALHVHKTAKLTSQCLQKYCKSQEKSRVRSLQNWAREPVLPWYDSKQDLLLLPTPPRYLRNAAEVSVSIVWCLLIAITRQRAIIIVIYVSMMTSWSNHPKESLMREYWYLGVFNVVVISADNSISKLCLMIDSLSEAFSSEF